MPSHGRSLFARSSVGATSGKRKIYFPQLRQLSAMSLANKAQGLDFHNND
jgi:hypothetical protein